MGYKASIGPWSYVPALPRRVEKVLTTLFTNRELPIKDPLFRFSPLAMRKIALQRIVAIARSDLRVDRVSPAKAGAEQFCLMVCQAMLASRCQLSFLNKVLLSPATVPQPYLNYYFCAFPQVLSGSNLFMELAIFAVPSPRSFWYTTPSWFTTKVITPELPYVAG